MSRTAVAEYNALVHGLSTATRYGLDDLLEAEHGGAEGERGGACITHVHVNLIPRAATLVDMFDGQLPSHDVDHALSTLTADAAPYILLRNARAVRLYEARGAPSQLIRRAMMAKLGREDWDWGAFPNLEVVEATIRMWQSEP